MALPKRALMRQIVERASNPRATEAHFGLVTNSQPLTLSSGVKKCRVAVDGSSVSQSCRYNAAYTPNAGDHVLLLAIGNNNRLRQRYIVICPLANSDDDGDDGTDVDDDRD